MPDSVKIMVNGTGVFVPSGTTVAAAIMIAGQSFRKSVHGEARGPVCGMGICFECRVTINGTQHCRSCQTLCEPEMQVTTDE